MKKIKEYLAATDCRQILKTSHVLFFSGLGAMVLCLMLIQGTEGSTGYLWMALSVVGVASCFGGLMFAAVKLRCPDCGKSLLPGGRMPMSLPAYCPHCGKKLMESTED